MGTNEITSGIPAVLIECIELVEEEKVGCEIGTAVFFELHNAGYHMQRALRIVEKYNALRRRG